MEEHAAVFEQTYHQYLSQLTEFDLDRTARKLELKNKDGAVEIRLFDRMYTVSPDGVYDHLDQKPNHSICVILLKYLMLCPETPSDDVSLVTFKDFKDAGPLGDYFQQNVKKPIQKTFTGKKDALERSALAIGGFADDKGLSYDLCLRFQALSKIPVYLYFNDADEDFPSDCTILFEKRTESYLDMECVAMIGGLLAGWLVKPKNTSRM